ncbi:H-NS family nucleoid-associated regulatory protein [Delftia sp. HK171]|uniref:H-NS histone family protein n=1 Tax=Delftia sp. HK171 TaxID=1920191 RepID=UPI00115033C1|nr:DNA-binding protein H-NS [Delftia sp. HK171]
MMNMNYRELLDKKNDLERSISNMRSKTISEIRSLINDFDIQAHELYEDKHLSSRKTLKAKYRDPRTGATWCGLGKAPRWIAGMDRTPFLIARDSSDFENS